MIELLNFHRLDKTDISLEESAEKLLTFLARFQNNPKFTLFTIAPEKKIENETLAEFYGVKISFCYFYSS
jgi:hypothetical protein